jgi:hypothetical protein
MKDIIENAEVAQIWRALLSSDGAAAWNGVWKFYNIVRGQYDGYMKKI